METDLVPTLALYLKMLVLVTTISVPNFMPVIKVHNSLKISS